MNSSNFRKVSSRNLSQWLFSMTSETKYELFEKLKILQIKEMPKSFDLVLY